MASYPETDPHSTSSFAEQAAATEFGRNYVHPKDRGFLHHPPEITPRQWYATGGFRGWR